MLPDHQRPPGGGCHANRQPKGRPELALEKSLKLPGTVQQAFKDLPWKPQDGRTDIVLRRRELVELLESTRPLDSQNLDINDVAAGYVTRQRWIPKERWVYAPDAAHDALISVELWNAAQARIAQSPTRARPGSRSPRSTRTPYVLRGLLHCGICGRKMEGSVSHETLRYRCQVTKTRALPEYVAHHPKSVYVREDAVVDALHRWIPTLVSAEALAASQACEEPHESTTGRRRLEEIDRSIRRLVVAIESGADPDSIKPRLLELRLERKAIEADLARRSHSPAPLTPAAIREVSERLGDLASVLDDATPSERAEIYRHLVLHVAYQPEAHALVATADLGRGVSRVGGGT